MTREVETAESISNLAREMNLAITQEQSFDSALLLQRECDAINRTAGTLTGTNCKKCNNRGFTAEIQDGYVVMKECSCMAERQSIWIVEKSGLKDQLDKCTFKNYKANTDWQKYIKAKATKFLDENEKWFFIGGQVGCGKTHICTAIAGELIKAGRPTAYMLWMDEVTKLKAIKMDDEGYNKSINRFKTAKVLYIDDFYKTERGKRPTTADINIAFEILNYRYNSKDLITIISSENTCDDILDTDEATGSRIYQKCGEYKISVGHDKEKNYRLSESGNAV